MKLGLEGKVVFITGGSKGIGLACARAFAGEGARIAIASRGQDNLETARLALANEGFDVITARADFSQPKEAQDAVSSAEHLLGPADVLVNCAGAARRFPVGELNAEAWRQGMDSKYFPYIHAMDAVRPGLIARKRGSIIDIIGLGGKAAQPIHLAGGAANAALMLVTVGWANALGKYGIRVNAINPGNTLTERVHESLKLTAQAEGITEAEAL